MGAKFTIILDTDDPQGLRDALQIATILNRNHHTGAGSYANKVKISKIDSSLRDCKEFADGKWGAFDSA